MKAFFISSTFKDMQAERDILHQRVFPRLRSLIRELGEDVQEVDLRWGVDTMNMTEEENGHEVLRVCIDAIDRCKPYLIVLLGERYGWIPGKSTVDSARDQRISTRYEEEMSITELEIRYGALLRDDAFDKCVFCFRDPGLLDAVDSTHLPMYQGESPLHTQRLTALKHQIRALEGARILEYTAGWDEENHAVTGLESFEEQIYQHLASLIRKDLEGTQPESLMEQQVCETEMIRKGYADAYVRRYPEEFLITKYTNRYQYLPYVTHGIYKRDILLVTGKPGTGKTTLMAYLAGAMPKYRHKAIACFAAASGCSDAAGLKRYIAHRLETILGQPHEEAEAVDQRLRKLDQKAVGEHIVCFVDGLDQIYQGVRDPYLDLPALCPNVFFIFSALPEFPMDRAAADYTCHTVTLEGLVPQQRRDLILATAGKRGKKLDEQLVEFIARQPGADNPLFLSLALQRLFMMNREEFEAAQALAPGMEGLHRYMQNLLTTMPDSPEEMAGYILTATAERFHQKDFREVVMLIASSRDGLTEHQLEDLLALNKVPFSPVKFQQIVSYLYDAFQQRFGGKWDFSHRLFREAVLADMTQQDHTRIRENLIRYTLTDEEFLRREGYRYLLEQRHPGFHRVLEQSANWENYGQIQDHLGASAAESGAIRQFLEEITREHPTDATAGFWLDFEDFRFGSDVEDMAGRIVAMLLDADVSHDRKWNLAIRSGYYVRPEELMILLETALSSVGKLPEQQRPIPRSSVLAERYRVLSALNRPHSEVHAALEEALEALEAAVKIPQGDLRWKEHKLLLETYDLLGRMAASWEEPGAIDIRLRALEYIRSLEPFAGDQEDDYTYYLVRSLDDLCDMYCAKPWRDYAKAKEYGDQGLELAARAASERPTLRNLKNQYNINASYTQRLKEEYTSPYRKQNVECARKIHALQRNNNTKRQLASAEAEYGLAYLQAEKAKVVSSVTHEHEDALAHLEHSAEIFEELIAQGWEPARTASHASFLVERMILRSRPYPRLMELGKRALELLHARKEQTQEQIRQAPPGADTRWYQSVVDWCDGWMGRAHAEMAAISQQIPDHAAALHHAREGIGLNRRNAQRRKSYIQELLSCHLIAAQSSYCLCLDDDALEYCHQLDQLLDELGSQGESREPMDAELSYIRGRVALKQGDPHTAWEYCESCAERKKTALLHRKNLILKAECLASLGNAGSDQVWMQALDAWHREFMQVCSSFRSVAQKTGDLPSAAGKNWPAYGNFALPAYYMAYCYHHCSNPPKNYDEIPRKTIFAMGYMDRGTLKGMLPQGFSTREAEFSPWEPALYPDIRSLLDAAQSMWNPEKKTAQSILFPMMETNLPMLLDSAMTPLQSAKLLNMAMTMYAQLAADNIELYSEFRHRDLLAELLGIGEGLPYFAQDLCCSGSRYTLWPRDYVQGLAKRWYTVLKLLLLVLGRYPGHTRNYSSSLRTVLTVVTEELGGSRLIEEADLSFLANWELSSLMDCCDPKTELRMCHHHANWYAMRSVCVLELYRRDGDPRVIAQRIRQLDDFLSPEYAELYTGFRHRGKTDMPTEVLNAVKHFARILMDRGLHDFALELIRWSETRPELAGKLDSATLLRLQSVTEEDRVWLMDLKMSHCRGWMENLNDRLYGLATM